MYQNRSFFSNLPDAVRTLLLINIALFVFTILVRRLGLDLNDWLGLHLVGSSKWMPWQYVTSMFMHGGLSHIFFNMFALYMFGRVLEQVWGSKRFIIYYMICGIGAGLFHNLVSWFEFNQVLAPCQAFMADQTPQNLLEITKHLDEGRFKMDVICDFIDTWRESGADAVYLAQASSMVQNIQEVYMRIVEESTVIGASGAVFGILLAFGMLFPNTELYIMFVPIPVKAKYFVIGYALLELYLGTGRIPGDDVAHFAHLGGMLFGYIILKFWQKNRKRFY